MIAAPADAAGGPNILWGCPGTSIATQTGIGYGSQNTATIMATCSDAGIGARLCDDYTSGGYSDWYMPSKDELTLLYNNKNTIGGFATSGTRPIYWSSSQSDANFVHSRWFSDGFQGTFSKNNAYRVRPIRSFLIINSLHTHFLNLFIHFIDHLLGAKLISIMRSG